MAKDANSVLGWLGLSKSNFLNFFSNKVVRTDIDIYELIADKKQNVTVPDGTFRIEIRTTDEVEIFFSNNLPVFLDDISKNNYTSKPIILQGQAYISRKDRFKLLTEKDNVKVTFMYDRLIKAGT